MNEGYNFEKIIKRSLNYKNECGYFVKSPTPIITSKSKKANITKATYINSALNDFIGLQKGKFIMIETKSTESIFYISKLKKHQEHSLQRNIDYGGYGFLIINFRKNDKTFIINYNNWASIKDSYKSLSYSKIKDDEYFIEIKKTNALTYDLIKEIELFIS